MDLEKLNMIIIQLRGFVSFFNYDLSE